MKLLGSIIYVTSAFYGFEGAVPSYYWTHSFFVISSYN